MKKKVIIFYCISLILFIQSCRFNDVKYDVYIDNEIREKIHNLNLEFIDNMTNKNTEKVRQMCSIDLLNASDDSLDNFISTINSDYKINKLNIIAEYYVKSSKISQGELIYANFNNPVNFTIYLPRIRKEMFITAILFEDSIKEQVLVMSYGKYDEEWKIINFQFGNYSYYNKNALDWFSESKKLFKKNYLLDASLRIVYAGNCLRPASSCWTYNSEKEIVEYSKYLADEYSKKYIFPIEINSIKSNPIIEKINYKFSTLSFCPEIVYKTNINIQDTVKLKEENIEIQKNIGNIFYGIEINNDLIYYKVTNLENSDTSNQFVEYIQNCNR